MKKINWGTKITIGASIYVIGILCFVAFSTTQKINLVTKDYYPKGIKYETKVQKIKNAHSLKEKLTIINKNEKLELKFPEEMISSLQGDIVLYRSSDYELDKKYTINTNPQGIQTINTTSLKNGRYIVKVEWQAEDIKYYMEQGVFISK